ncbi:zinc ABC transporter substrate-binding protein [Marivivens sp. LCG002]|uniref:zinc ABC transporter substrate-binding protein n=1 Tax=Marivivens sp. LCG002 TaxID=3051171 RepID=UPI002554943B|nr:zinc ABC transporter substrate-binding protein [Marivivens sp. LCG002]WIV51512.1 zinc ABC transporter substrate-binding protein [Marivivens sp. LCG002]
MLIRSLPFLLLALPAHAQSLTIVTDIPPLAAIASAVVGPDVEVRALLPQGGSPHDFAMRPSDARMLHGADVVFWSGEGMSPWMEQALESLDGETIIIEAFETQGWTPLPLRDLEAIGHVENHEEHEHEVDHGHGHGDFDPHAWLSPLNAAAWAETLADVLTQNNLAGVEVSANAQTFAMEMGALETALKAEAEKLRGKGYLVSHDSFQYLETALDLPASGAIALSDASASGPAHIAVLKEQVVAQGISCILTDPQSNPDLAALVAEGTEANIAMVNPLGNAELTGAEYYRALLGGILVTLAECTGATN